MLQLTGHQGTIHALTFTADGQSLISAGRDGTIRVWDMASGAERSKLIGHAGPVLSIAAHPKGRALASGGADGTLKIWDLTTDCVIDSHPGQLAAVTGVAWLANATSLLMTCGERLRPDRPGELRLWNFDHAKPVKNLRTEAQGLWSLAVNASGTTVAWAGGARCVAAWETSHQTPKSLRQPAASLAVALAPDGLTLASAVDRAVKVWDVATGRERGTLEGHRGLVRSLAFSPCGRSLLSGSQDQTVRQWHLAGSSLSCGPVYQWPTGGVHAVTYSPDGLTAAAAGELGAIWVWDMEE